MPWAIRHSGGKFQVINKDTGDLKGTHDSEEEARDQLRALYANVKEGGEELTFDEFVEKHGLDAEITLEQYAEAYGEEPELTLHQFDEATGTPTYTFEEMVREIVPRGDRGPRGSRGERGLAGLPGPTGPQGPPGPVGATGVAGGAGADGLPGHTGPAGPQGPKGDKGDVGDRGPRGLTGNTGARGERGPIGPQGYPGRDGKEGPQGPQGIQGPEGREGRQGPEGKPGKSPTILANADPKIPSLRSLGFDANEAAPGNHWHHMPESQHARRHGLRQNIDPIFPLQGTINGYVLSFNAASPEHLEWVAQTGGTGGTGSVGPQGPIGPMGPPGFDGRDGLDGLDGLPGPTGPAGATGAQGPQGDPGTTGQPGNDGAPGATGAQGPPGFAFDGEDGQDGDWGPPGPTGATGATGAQGPQGDPGTTGATGADGAAGPQGIAGPMGMAGMDGEDGEDSIGGRIAPSVTIPANVGLASSLGGSGFSPDGHVHAHGSLAGPGGAHRHQDIDTRNASVMRQSIMLTAGGGAPTSGSPCGTVSQFETSTNKVNRWTLPFGSASSSYAFWGPIPVPGNYDNGSLYAEFHANGTAVGTAAWEARFLCLPQNGILDTAYGNAATAQTIIGTANNHEVSGTTNAVAPGGTAQGSAELYVRVGRIRGGAPTDNLPGSAFLTGVRIWYGVNALSGE